MCTSTLIQIYTVWVESNSNLKNLRIHDLAKYEFWIFAIIQNCDFDIFEGLQFFNIANFWPSSKGSVNFQLEYITIISNSAHVRPFSLPLKKSTGLKSLLQQGQIWKIVEKFMNSWRHCWPLALRCRKCVKTGQKKN